MMIDKGHVTVIYWTEQTEGPEGQKSRVSGIDQFPNAKASWPAQGPVVVEDSTGTHHLYNPADIVKMTYTPNMEAN
jgi:hypothetical protein